MEQVEGPGIGPILSTTHTTTAVSYRKVDIQNIAFYTIIEKSLNNLIVLFLSASHPTIDADTIYLTFLVYYASGTETFRS